ncbi:hypothetical protein EG329_013748 [Mollisiaceae sp. DMI_Dod_QoI]|nr:hypothetical protein EG329_013748 [Helotiales sp. DMI_Dod_QoI]
MTTPLVAYLMMPPSQRPQVHDLILPAIHNFLQSCSLNPPTVTDRQPHTNLNERYGTIILPLWEQSPSMNSNSVNWQAFNTFLDTLALVLLPLSAQASAGVPLAFQKRNAALAYTTRCNPTRTSDRTPNRYELFRNCSIECQLDTRFYADVDESWEFVCGCLCGGELRGRGYVDGDIKSDPENGDGRWRCVDYEYRCTDGRDAICGAEMPVGVLFAIIQSTSRLVAGVLGSRQAALRCGKIDGVGFRTMQTRAISYLRQAAN